MPLKSPAESSPVPVPCEQHGLLYQHSFFGDQLKRFGHSLLLNKPMKTGTIPGGEILFNRGNTETKFLGDHFYWHGFMEVILNVAYDLFRPAVARCLFPGR